MVKAKPGRDFFPACQQVVLEGEGLDLNKIPMIRPYPGDAGKIITLGLVITKDCETGTPNVGVYRLQLQSKIHDDCTLVIGAGRGAALAEKRRRLVKS